MKTTVDNPKFLIGVIASMLVYFILGFVTAKLNDDPRIEKAIKILKEDEILKCAPNSIKCAQGRYEFNPRIRRALWVLEGYKGEF